ncbi:MAG: trypsin-like peptidase domain-containing protein [Tepidisphaeraceae bacterium]
MRFGRGVALAAAIITGLCFQFQSGGDTPRAIGAASAADTHLAADSTPAVKIPAPASAQVPQDPRNLAQSDARAASDTLGLAGLQDQFEQIAKRVAPAVVAISASTTAVDAEGAVRSDDINAEKLASILDRTTRTVGTGFVFDPDGYILTNEHVVGEAQQLWVTTDDHKVLPAIVIGSDPRADLAVLKVPARNMKTVRFAAFDTVRRGQWTIALGNPYGYAFDGEMCISVGVVSATRRSLPKLSVKENRLYSNLIQTTAEINPGNSGGPLLNLDGQVVGINTAVVLPQKQTNGIAFAVPVSPRLMSLVQSLKQGREIVYGYIGVIVSTPTVRERRAAGLDHDYGVRVDEIEPRSPAEDLLNEGDVVLDINGEIVRDSDEFVRLIGEASAEAPAKVNVYRDGKTTTILIKPGRRDLPSVAVTRQSQRLRWRGMLLGPIPDHWNDAAAAIPASEKVSSGLMVLALDDDSPFARRGVKLGTVVTAVAGKSVATVSDLQSVLNDTPSEQCELTTLPAIGAARETAVTDVR